LVDGLISREHQSAHDLRLRVMARGGAESPTF